MNHYRDQPENPWAPVRRSSSAKMITIAVVVAVALLGAGGSAWFFAQDGGGDDTEISGETSAPSAVNSTTITTTIRTSIATVTTVVVSAETSLTDLGATPTSSVEPEALSGTTALACDGRGVLIVNSVMGNSPDFDGEIGRSLEQYPGAIVLPPDTCPSLRSYDDHGVPIYAVVLDYESDVGTLCAAEVPGQRNARILGSGTPYTSSPC